MGLDMYLTKRRRGANPEDVLVAYWRKANHIHGWFERNVSDGYNENCELYPICKGDLKCLMADCRVVLDNPACASRVLPREEGFFFGDQQYGADYFDSIESTAELLKRVIENIPDDEELFYHAWW